MFEDNDKNYIGDQLKYDIIENVIDFPGYEVYVISLRIFSRVLMWVL